eukprot:11896100-Prorocentrum_lima.AAC.1
MSFSLQLQQLQHMRRRALAGLRRARLRTGWKAFSRTSRIRGALQRCWRDRPCLLAILATWRL